MSKKTRAYGPKIKAPPLLLAMRFIVENIDDETKDQTSLQKFARAEFKESPSKFRANYRKMEMDFVKFKHSASSTNMEKNQSGETQDLGTQKCLELAEKLLAQIGVSK